ncbi:MAG: TetR/AcrR family transcriptional regulator [Actinomycetota bacterium]
MATAETGRPTRGEKRRVAIERAAIDEFMAHGVAGASMARIAAAAGVSRPALYQYYRDKRAVLAASFVNILDQRVEAALTALAEPGTVAEQLDGFLQRYEGDLWEQMSASEHTGEIIDAKDAGMRSEMSATEERRRVALLTYFESVDPGDSQTQRAMRASWVELLGLAPRGLWADEPTVEAFRQRLTTLAVVFAASVESNRNRHKQPSPGSERRDSPAT